MKLSLFIRIVLIVLLLFSSVGALFGGWSLMKYSDGSGLQLPLEYLNKTAFGDYFVPGLILFISIGVLSLIVTISILFKFKHSGKLIFLQGIIMLGWILVQMLMIQVLFYLQFVFIGIGLCLVLAGWFEMSNKRKKKA